MGLFHLQIFGWPGVGKETIARLICEETGAFLFRNHYAVDVAFSMLPDGAMPNDDFWENVADLNASLENIVETARPEQSIIYTNYLTEDESEWVKLERRRARARRLGATFLLVRLDCDLPENTRRIRGETRVGKKMSSTDQLLEHRQKFSLIQVDLDSTDLILDVSNLSVQQSAENIQNLLADNKKS